jgi:hypothetical protein
MLLRAQEGRGCPSVITSGYGKPAMENAVHDMLHDMVASRLHDREDARHVHANRRLIEENDPNQVAPTVPVVLKL